jgi:putative CocE/NonD family hydrolase
VYHVGGWYDIFLAGTLNNYTGIRSHGATPEARHNQKLIVGPWIQGPDNVGKVEVGEMNYPGADTYPDGEALNYATLRRKWFDVWLKDMDTGFTKEKPVLLYVMGNNVWRFEDSWPLARAQDTLFYFHGGSSGSSASLNDGLLSMEKPADAQSPDSFKYDPLDPVMTVGGNTLFIPSGPRDNRQAEQRSLTYTSEVLNEDLEVTGPVTAVLYGMSSAVDTDWTVTVTDVYPDGRSMLVVDGIQRARFRDSQTDPTLIEPDKIYRYEVDLWATSNVFKAGHRIRVSVQSSNFPRWSRNLNTAESPETGARSVVALNTVFHDELRPSHVVLPVVPR